MFYLVTKVNGCVGYSGQASVDRSVSFGVDRLSGELLGDHPYRIKNE